jgi:1-acyl-sn-glycerol-3-phosphate acyltransferase
MRFLFFLFYYGTFHGFFGLIFRGIFRTQIIGRDRVPLQGGLLTVCNHISYVDPPLLAIATPRPVEFMTMAEMFRRPLMAKVLGIMGCFPVDRTRAGHGAAREAIRRLRNGRCVAIFPEAGIRVGEKSVLGGDPIFKPGAGSVALLGGAAILPVIVRGTRAPYRWQNWFRRETMTVTFGCPFSLWVPAQLSSDQRRTAAREVLREQLLKTVELT